MSRRCARARRPRDDDGLMAALGAILADTKLEPAFIALTLVAAERSRYRPRNRLRCRSRCDLCRAPQAARGDRRRATARRWPTPIERLSRPAPISPDAASAGRRPLKNACLDLLAITANDDAIARAFAQYQNADNMTDRMAALETLAQHDRPERTAALDDFYKRYADDPLIIDKWLALQAAIPEPATLDRVRALTEHPAFSVANPNRVRALIGSFAQVNHTQFNRADGAGYDFVADFVLALDPKNPQVAARLMGAFRSWRALEVDAPGPRRGDAAAGRGGGIPVARRARHRRADARRKLSGIRRAIVTPSDPGRHVFESTRNSNCTRSQPAQT